MALGLIEVVMLIAAVVTILWSESIVRIFTSDPGVVPLATVFLKIAIIGFFMMGVCQVMFQCLNHVGDTVPPLVIFVVAVWLVELPLAYFLPEVTGLGVYGLRWAIVAHLVLAAAAYAIYWQRGRWKRKQV